MLGELGFRVAGANRITDWGLRTALPFWSAHGWDTAHGGYLESVTLEGAPVSGDQRRVRVQARQIYVFARAELEGWHTGLARAIEAATLLKARAWRAGGHDGWAHLLAHDGQVIDQRRDLYDHAFILLSLAWLGRASGDEAWFALADETLAFLDRDMADANGGYVEALGGGRPLPRRQNPHMHLFEALMALYEATGRSDFLDRARVIKQLFDQHFYDVGQGVLGEFFTAVWAVDDGISGETIEPGHLCEWVWLLHEFARLSGEAVSPAAATLFESAMRNGINAGSGLLHATSDRQGRALDESSRAWMQTEWIRAAARLSRTGHDGAARWLETACEATFEHHLTPALAGGWIDQIDGKGRGASGSIPASTLYHFFGCVAECQALLNKV